MSDDAERDRGRGDEIDEEMARADRTNGEGSPGPDRQDRRARSAGSDPDAPGAYVDDEDATDVAEPNEPA
jgi:hypothetical protein